MQENNRVVKSIQKISCMLIFILLWQILVPVIGNMKFTITSNAATYGDFEYEIDNKTDTVTIKKYKGNEAEVTIPEQIEGKNVTSLGDWSFYNCDSIRAITIPNTVTNMGFAAFSGCSSLTNIDIPNGVTVISNQLLEGCSSLVKIEIPEAVTEIRSYAFHKCTNLETIEIPDTVNSIYPKVFQYCQRLKNIKIPQNANCANQMFFNSILQIWTAIGEGEEQEILLPDTIVRSKKEEDNLYTESEFTLLNCKISEDKSSIASKFSLSILTIFSCIIKPRNI